MKVFLILSAVFFTTGLFAQRYDSLGIDNNPLMNKNEAMLLNTLLEETRGTFDFAGKKVAFVTGSSGRTITSKFNYFNDLVLPWIKADSKPQIFMVILTADEKIRSGGYDALVFSWVKIFTPKTRKRVVRQLGEKMQA